MGEVLNVTVREKLGTSSSRRLRRAGRVPAVLYGHGKESISLAVPHEEVEALIRHGSKLVDLAGAVQESALVRDIQWDPLGVEVLHLDLTRVGRDERVVTNVTLELRGVAPGTKEGGMIEQPLHEVSLDCPVTAIPDKIEVNINELHLGQSLLVSDLELGEGVKLVTDPEQVVVHCVQPAAEMEAEEVPLAVSEPELIGRRAEAEEGGEE